jgi:stage V sporulation protein AA
MGMKEETIYLKTDMHILVYERTVRIDDIAKIEGTNPLLLDQIRHLALYTFPQTVLEKKSQNTSTVFSILKVLQCIHNAFPNVEIVNLGEEDFIVEYIPSQKPSRVVEKIKLILICMITFFGSAFTIMAFNNDISVTEVFDQYYGQVIGNDKPQVSELEICYCIGIALGILIFFNHVGRKKITTDPTPIQIEMRKYENDMNTTFIENASRKGHNEDVD